MDEIFDLISYSKGASVIRMLHNYIGDEVTKLHSHAHANDELLINKSFLSVLGVQEWPP